MDKQPQNIKFQNSQNPSAAFDIIQLEELLLRTDLDHSPLDLHRVEFYIMILIEKGNYKHTIDFIDYDCKKGSLLTIRKDQIHRFHNNKTVKGKLLLFTDEFLISYLEKLEALKALQLFNEILGNPKIILPKTSFQEVCTIIESIQKEYFKVNDAFSQGIIRSQLHILIAYLFRIKSHNNPQSNQRKYLSEFIEFQNLVEQNAAKYTKVKEYAKLLNVSTKTLNTITKTIIGKSAKAFIDDICTKQIKRLLINSELPIKEVAYASGFEETTNFYKYFKRQTTLTPEQFRSNFQ